MRAYQGIAVLFFIAAVLPGQVTPLQIATDSLPAASIGTAYLQQLTTTGGSCPAPGTATNTIDDGALPGGLFVASPAGEKRWIIQGAPTTAGTFRFTLRIRWRHNRSTPFDQDCLDEAVKSLTITVLGTSQAPLIVDRTQVSVTHRTAHFPPGAETVRVTSSGNAAASFTAQAATASGGNWLSVTPLSATTPANLSLAFRVTDLQPGVYTGTVTVASDPASPVVIGVTLTVIADSNIVLQATPASVAFSSIAGGQNPAAQSISVSAAGEGVIFQVEVSAPPNNKWLVASPAGAATPARLTVSVDSKDLTAGTYSGSIRLRLAGSTSISQTVPVTFNIQSAPVVPAITQNGVVSAASLSGAIAPGTWVSIFGANLSPTTRQWRDADFVNGRLPIVLDGVSVTINGIAAPVAYISPTQINVVAPDDTATGLVFAQVKSPAGTSAGALVLEQTIAPAFFQFPAGTTVYVAGTHADGSYIAGPRLTQLGTLGTPAKPGETVVLYGTGFGATQPPISATALVPFARPIANPQDLRIRIGGLDAAIAFAGLISPGLYQFNVVVPQLPDGDHVIIAELRGLLTRSDLLLSVQR